jgi:hypothetical protein
MALSASRFFSTYPSTQYRGSAITSHPGTFPICIFKKSEGVMCIIIKNP